jgi:DNA replication protein DnaC
MSITLPFLLKELKLKSMLENWNNFSDLAIKNSWSHSEYLKKLCEEEISLKNQKRIGKYLKEAKLPINKSLSNFNFNDIKIDKKQIEYLSSSDQWIKNKENILFFGPSGCGKTHLASAIANGHVEKGIRVKFFTSSGIIQHLEKAKIELNLQKELEKLDRYKILIIDDIGYVKRSQMETSLLFELISHRYENTSLIITSNHPFEDWNNIFEDNMMTVAAIDRIIHHCSIINCSTVESYRKKESLKKIITKNS